MTIKEARENKGLTQVQLAAMTGVGLGTIQRIENGKLEKALVGNVRKICDALGYDFASLFCKD